MAGQGIREAPSIKIVGRRRAEDHSLEDASRLLHTAWALRGDRPLAPAGVYRFRSFQEADEWMTRMIARSSALVRAPTLDDLARIYLDETVAMKIRQIAKAVSRSQAEVIRDALAAYTREAERPRPKGVGGYRSGRSDVSEQAEEILRRAARKGR